MSLNSWEVLSEGEKARNALDFETLVAYVQELDLESVLRDLGLEFTVVGEEAQLHCPFHAPKSRAPTCYLRLQGDHKGMWHCWSSRCGRKGFFVRFVRDVLATNTANALHYLGISQAPLLGYDLGERLIATLESLVTGDSEPIHHPLPEPVATMPAGYLDHGMIDAYIATRGYRTERDLNWFRREWEPRYVPMHGQTAGRWGDRILFPVRDWGDEMRFFFGRSTNPNASVKVLYPKGYPVGRYFFGEWRFHNIAPRRIVLCEGPFDCMRLWWIGVPALACFSAKITEAQVARLLRWSGSLPYLPLIEIAFDGDESGREGAEAVKGTLSPYFDVEIVRFPDGKDPGDLVDYEEYAALERED